MTENNPKKDTTFASGVSPEPDAHGQAAMFLLESLIHGLVARSALSVEEAVEIVEIAADVKEMVAAETHESNETMLKSLSLLQAISASLKIDT